MKSWIILITIVVATLFLLGCIQSTGSGLMALDKDANISNNNKIDSNSNVFNNLNDFKKVKTGDNVAVDYTGRLVDGTIFDSSVGKTPLEFDVGAGQMIKGFDDGVVGMAVGEKKVVTIPPEQAYGKYDPNLVKVFDLNSPQLSSLGKLKIGMELISGSGIVKVVAVTDTNVSIDFNPKLAGKTLIFEITLVSIN